MLDYFAFFDYDFSSKEEIKGYLKNNIYDICFVETLIKYLEERLKQNKSKVELRCNVRDLIDDLDFLKQYLDD